jgi:UrcA family protein
MHVAHEWIASAAVTAVLALAGSPASAADVARNAPTRTVKDWDLDLASSADRQTLRKRVQDAASDVCRDEVNRHRRNTRLPPPTGWYERCVSAAVDGAQREIDGYRAVAAAAGRTWRLL